MSVASITIEVNAAGATRAVNNVTGEFISMGAAAKAVGLQTSNAGDQMSAGLTRARQSSMLLREETGIFLPRALQTVIAQSQLLGPIMNAAFSGFAVLGFIDLIVSIPRKLDDLSESLSHEKAAAEASSKAQQELNKALAAGVEQSLKFQEEMDLVGKSGSARFAAQAAGATAFLSLQETTLENMQSEMEANQALLNQEKERLRVMAGPFVPGVSAKENDLKAKIDGENAKIEEQKNKVNEASNAVMLYTAQQGQAFGDERQKQIDETTKKMEEQRKVAQNLVDQVLKGQDEVDKMYDENNAKIAENTDKRLRDEQDVQDKMLEATVERYNKAEESDRHYAEEQTRAQQKAIEEQKRYADEWIQQRDRMANSIATLFEDITSGNIGSRFKKMFEQLMAEMVADWLMGVNAMGAATSSVMLGGGGGGIGGLNRGGGPLGLLSSVFGLSGRSQGIGFPNSLAGGSGGFAGIGTPSFSDVGTSDISLGLGGSLSSGLPTFGVGGLPAGAGVTGTAARPQGWGSLFSNGGLSTLLAAGGSLAGLSLIGSQNPALRGIGGAGLGFGIGTLLGGLSTSLVEAGIIGPGLAALLGTAGGPIGAAIGGVIALASALGPKHQQDRHNFEMAELDSISKVIAAYQNNSTDYKSAVQALEQMRQAGDQQFATWGTSNHAGEQVDAHIDLAESQLSSAEATRQAQLQAQAAEQARRAGLQFGPALFARGGLVGDYAGTAPPWFAASARYYASGGDVVPAMLTPGEFVMNRQATQRIGASKLAAMNSSGGGDELHIHIHAVDAPSFQALLDKGLDKQIAAAIIKLRYQGIKVA